MMPRQTKKKPIRQMKAVDHNEICTDDITGSVLRQSTSDDVPSGIRTRDYNIRAVVYQIWRILLGVFVYLHMNIIIFNFATLIKH
jgi:hypothetical protein